MALSSRQNWLAIHIRSKPTRPWACHVCQFRLGCTNRAYWQKLYLLTLSRAAGIAPASRNPQVVMQHDRCVDTPPPCLHTACTDFALRELVACWQQLSADVRERIVRIARGQGDISRVGE